jgi:ElaB/YqjD/DUF883 family membrane-anchored ribosome-binding protein
MTPEEQRLIEDRATRNAARAVFDTRLANVRAALAERSVGQRLTTEAVDRTKAATTEATTIAKENSWVIVATAATLAGWLARRPLLRLAQRLYAHSHGGEPDSRWMRFIASTAKRIRT